MNEMSPGRIADPAARPPRPRLAIVSTFDELCGIAGYTRALVPQIEEFFDVTVLDLDQYLVRTANRKVQRLGDSFVREMAEKLKGFDFVNIQLEHGTLGTTPASILRRFRWLAKAAPGLSVTFHTVFSNERFDWETFFLKLASLRWGKAADMIAAHHRGRRLSGGVYDLLRRLCEKKPVRIIVHAKRDMRMMRDVYRLKHVYHHPLAYVRPEARDAMLASVRREDFPLLRCLPEHAKLIGTFGFISAYKGFDTVIRALRHLPDDHHLLIFGGVHPESIKRQLPIDPYVQKLLDEAYVDTTVFDQVARTKNSANVSVTIDGGGRDLLGEHPRSLAGRVHFMGPLADLDFLGAMSVCDSVVLSYLEVGQSASGPASMALDMGCRVIASRNKTFLQLSRYHPGQMEFFDIGNYLELAERLMAESPIDCKARRLRYNARTNAALYAAVNRPGLAPIPDEDSAVSPALAVG